MRTKTTTTMMKATILLGALAGSPLVAGCATECGEGTHLDGNECKTGLQPLCGTGTELKDGACRPTEGGGGECGPGTHLEDGLCVSNLSSTGNVGRIAKFQIDLPAELGAGANDVLRDEFSTGSSLMFVSAYSPKDGTLRIFTATGESNGDGTFGLDRASVSETAGTDTGGVLTTEPFQFDLHALSDTPIIFRDTSLSEGVIEVVGGFRMVKSAKFTGVLVKADADQVYIDLGNAFLGDLVVGFGAQPDTDYGSTGSNNAWHVEGTFETEPVWLLDDE